MSVSLPSGGVVLALAICVSGSAARAATPAAAPAWSTPLRVRRESIPSLLLLIALPRRTVAGSVQPKSARRHPLTESLRAAGGLANPFALRVEQRLPGDDPGDPLTEDVDLDSGLERDLGRQVCVGDRVFDGVAVTAARDPAEDLAADPNRLVAEGDRARILEDQAPQPPRRLGGALRFERVAAEELALRLDAEAQPRLVGGLVGGDVGCPDAVALLQAQRVDRPVAAGVQAVSAA